MSQNQALALEPQPAHVLIGQSAHAQRLRTFASQAARVRHSVLLLGETGSGKDLVAKMIHSQKTRSGQFVLVNCAAIPEALFESELFGHGKGAFTGAQESKPGLFETAEHGTIFLNEIGELPSAMQAKLLEALENGNYRRVGEVTGKTIKTRIIAATNVNIKKALSEGKMRSDLYHRINVLPMTVPPLRERREDIPDLANYFLRQEDDAKTIAPETMAVFRKYEWPGNVRELKNTVIRAVFNSNGEPSIGPEHVRPHLKEEPPQGNENWVQRLVPNSQEKFPTFGAVTQAAEREYLKEVLTRTGGNVKKAAQLAGTCYRKLLLEVQKHNLRDLVRELRNPYSE
ncbi:MAG: hypothetical protein A3J09_00990 [Candidatus Zambryskibacteria bacterium RIFCSPLOWO2_02_FULL_51_21]|uniref:Sigma-54 factor interaction domain-containing protein n=1 Tax=Candidatus Zambryskibacteria bacterium RIFCSPHIGHO2_02_FULL_43_37 TaxID=1802749 RepID=A0A1G2THU4_9BACT|nr:MAG: hypothetical protein A2723_00990 [Candidatus Zambryskibacteria bacterium RIFCSPHIGHO2_01_FULL_52_18]OHA96773.1 MAG: hypothetical protein A3D49_02950 [Candidatus Zambryskibacteria bacterium RIFCSPHIGHO2_02_FULL_43_37]OHB07467.1 MAG: hypothetical protein A2944_02020 [Candidatus Zambryskibacteria bacterium RIFCSPLOWO2_01_FULL_52_12]OHB11130.1 MAG: hypothetical protein A3J09_00990 [Candidatus Zambryskibacteria bacterium RIFCSPLOWO2_02_FULL_51_21]